MNNNKNELNQVLNLVRKHAKDQQKSVVVHILHGTTSNISQLQWQN